MQSFLLTAHHIALPFFTNLPPFALSSTLPPPLRPKNELFFFFIAWPRLMELALGLPPLIITLALALGCRYRPLLAAPCCGGLIGCLGG